MSLREIDPCMPPVKPGPGKGLPEKLVEVKPVLAELPVKI